MIALSDRRPCCHDIPLLSWSAERAEVFDQGWFSNFHLVVVVVFMDSSKYWNLQYFEDQTSTEYMNHERSHERCPRKCPRKCPIKRSVFTSSVFTCSVLCPKEVGLKMTNLVVLVVCQCENAPPLFKPPFLQNSDSVSRG